MKTVYMIGIKGMGMASLAILYSQMGYRVSGSDSLETFPTDLLLEKYDIVIKEGFNEKNLPDNVDLVVTTGAHKGLGNREVLEAKKRSIPVYSHAQALGILMDKFKLKIAVCGTHGKTTTSSIIAYVLSKSRLKGAHLVGTPFFSDTTGGYFKGFDYLIVEADEYFASAGIDNTPRFAYLYPDIVVATNIDWDHPDVYKSIDEVRDAFELFFLNLIKSPKKELIYCADNRILEKTAQKIKNINTFSYGLSKNCSAQIKNKYFRNKHSYFQIESSRPISGTYSIGLAGDHNILNTTAAICALHSIGLSADFISSSLKNFSFISRRFELKQSFNNIFLYDDYAHHPAEIKSLLCQAKQTHRAKRIILIHQPHTYSRLSVFENEFIKALSHADICFVLPVFASARETENPVVSSEHLVEKARESGLSNIYHTGSSRLNKHLSGILRKGDIIITSGAGDLYKYHRQIIEIIKNIK